MIGSLFSKVILPATVVGAIVAQTFGEHAYRDCDLSDFPIYVCDTVVYPVDGYKRGWTEEDFILAKNKGSIADSLIVSDASLFTEEEEGRPVAMDTIIPPDSLRISDPFLFAFYPAVKDSLCHVYVRDSLIAAGDSLQWPAIDSLYYADSLIRAKEAFARWYASLDDYARKRYDAEVKGARQKAISDSIMNVRDSLKAIRDSIVENTPRILETYILPDSMKYKRIISWTHERDFHNISIRGEDTSLNYRFYDYAFQRHSVNASWLGVSGSPTLDFDYTKRKSAEGVTFYDTQESWSYSPETLPMYNTKTPYTELAYSGGLFSTDQKVTDNVHVMTTQNILPAWNIMLNYDSYSARGILDREKSKNRNFNFGTNFLGKKYLMHAGYIYNMVNREENGGLFDNEEFERATTDPKGMAINLRDAESRITKHSVFVDQQYRIPFYFIERWRERRKAAADTMTLDGLMPADSLSAADMPADSTLAVEEIETGEAAAEIPVPQSDNITTAFIGHSSEFSVYKRVYHDKISDQAGKDFYNDVFNYNPSVSNDSLRTMKVENKVFIRLQPWAQEAVVSKLDVGLGNRISKYVLMDRSYLHGPGSETWNTTYLYAGVDGKLKKYIDWNAAGHYSLFGSEAGDFDISANAVFRIYPFRKARTSPVSLGVNFSTSLKEPAFYTQHLYTNHYSWDNSFSKISDTRIKGSLSIPRWAMTVSAAYGLLGNGIYYDTLGIVRQSDKAVSILTLGLDKDLRLGRYVHLDNRLLFQISSDNTVVNVPMFAANLRYYVQVPLFHNAMDMQAGVNVWYNTKWYAPGWNPVLGVFHNQARTEYGNNPFMDVFLNVRWKRAIVFLKGENILMGIPSRDFYSADHYIRTTRTFKVGIFWPFYTQPFSAHSHQDGDGHGHGAASEKKFSK